MIVPPHESFDIHYEINLLNNIKRKECKVFDCAFSLDKNYIAACNSNGKLSVWKLTTLLREDNENILPLFTFQAHHGQIYTCAFGGSPVDAVLITGADEEIRIWSWNELLAGKFEFKQELHHQQSRGNRGAMMPKSETNDIAIDLNTQKLFAASGDNLAYEWDIATGRCVQPFGAHMDYVHSVSYAKTRQELCTGSEDGTIGIWDVRCGKSIQVLQPLSTSVDAGAPRNWVGSVRVDASDAWMVCGGGKKRGTGKGSKGGYISMWHLPSRTRTMELATEADTQMATFFNDEILSVGNMAKVYYRNRNNGEARACGSTSIPSLYFASVDEESQLMITGGCSPYLDVFTTPGFCSLSIPFEAQQSI